MTVSIKKIDKPTIFVAPLSNWLEIEDLLTRVINRAYDKPRYKYNIILTPRIKYGLAQDFVIEDINKAILAIWVVPSTGKNIKVEQGDDKDTVTRKLIENYPIGTLDLDNTLIETEITPLLTKESLKTLEGRILATVCLKSYANDKNGMEITGFTSFYPNLSSQLMLFARNYSLEHHNVQKLWVEVVQEHDLVPYYEKQGFTLLDSKLCVVNTKTHKSADQPLENGIEASQNFHVALMSMRTTKA
ncbi:hypothetical protein HII13_001661 [Brettanomyces bruxellensis]|uniref:Uncharacterized protein n=1 Tax=Dekkera bruxellensis TaxID=5007 RepID=A0A8H6BIH2_DEKBR|nr:uncharacterized protein BRETT_003762 [Brettanomyces bruxellensis]KAF6012406.1 hypothetical protein HII13_001661 [Brettanomyces bruxellensis]QOU19612.1 hypothetical protein BRETT_003762 [Brettanomyces bruxellensis]